LLMLKVKMKVINWEGVVNAIGTLVLILFTVDNFYRLQNAKSLSQIIMGIVGFLFVFVVVLIFNLKEVDSKKGL